MKTIEYRDGVVTLIDQTRLPGTVEFLECRDHRVLCEAIRMLRVRGAPAIGIAGAYGVALAAHEQVSTDPSTVEFRDGVLRAIEELRATRPTAVNLSWALDRMARRLEQGPSDAVDAIRGLEQEAGAIAGEDDRANRAMGAYGAELIADGSNILTHCNAGGLATGEFGTALGVIMTAHRQGKRVHVWVDETRPLLQGARLTAWELEQEGIPYTVITDNMAGHFMSQGRIDCAIVGADRIAANGDAANKIGTYSVAVLARYHELPLYVVAPTSTVDLTSGSGGEIVIEQRHADEVRAFAGVRTVPAGAQVANPAFDVTPAELIAAIVTETGVLRSPYARSLARAVQDTRVGV